MGTLLVDAWVEAFPWLVQGTTTRGSATGRGERPFDLGLFSGGSPVDEVRRNWKELAADLGARAVVHAHQPHGSQVRVWTEDSGSPGEDEVPILVEPCDAHVSDRAGVLLAVTVADCVPVFMVDPRQRVVAMVHAGWRGGAAGIVEEAADCMLRRFASRAEDLYVHLGPAICGECYEVGPEVHEALHQPVPTGPEPIDLRAILARRVIAVGVDLRRLTLSTHCTLCGDAGLFSHRAGAAERQVGYLGIRS